MEIFDLILSSLWFILPAYVANATPVIFGGGTPMDLGNEFFDGERILGDGKTVRGFVLGVIAGSVVGVLQGHPKIGFLLSMGALLGDVIGSFIKRRAGLQSGELAPGLDQLEFIVMALILVSFLEPPSWDRVTVLLILTPAIHLGTNFASYRLGFKSNPY